MLERNQHGQHYETYGSCGFVNYRLINGWIADIARERMKEETQLTGNDELTQFNGYMSEDNSNEC